MSFSDTPRLRSFVVVSLLLGALGLHFAAARQGWSNPGLLGHGFRQAQTALSVDAMRADGFKLDYATPVLGKPWSIPMEFPLYQWLAVKVGEMTGWPTAPAGRAVSLAAFYLGLPALWLVFRMAGADRLQSGLLLLPVLATPVYVFYSRAVLIESFAWAASAWFWACAFQWVRNRQPAWLVGAWLAGGAAALVKGTTWAVFLVPLATVLLAAAWRSEPGQRVRAMRREIVRGVWLVLPPLCAGLVWVGYADRIKEENPLAAFLVSGHLAGFNFGALSERFSGAFWSDIAGHWFRTGMPWWSWALAVVGVFFAPPRWRRIGAVASGGFLAGPLVFANLYRIHDYYHFATAGFGAVAAGAVLVGLASEGCGWRRWLGAGGLVALLVGQGLTYRREYHGMQTQPFDGAGPLALQIERLTLPGDVFVVHGSDWSSELPYYARRRALVVPEGQLAIAAEAVEANIRLLRDEPVALVVFIGAARGRRELIERRIRDFALWPEPLFVVGDDTVVYAAERDFLRMATVLRTDENAPGVRAVGRGPELSASAVPQELGARFAGAFPYLQPAPVRGVLPFGYVLFNDGGRRLFMANVPTTLDFDPPAGAAAVALAYRVYAEAFSQRDFAGVRFVVEWRDATGRVQVLLEDWIGPDSPEEERGRHERVVPLPAGAHGEVVFRTLAGPSGNAAFGWAVLERLEIR